MGNDSLKTPLFPEKDLSEHAAELGTWATLITKCAEANRHLPQSFEMAPARALLPALHAQYAKACQAFLQRLGIDASTVPELIRPPVPAAAPALTPYRGSDGREGGPVGHAV